ncbi:hypothetical protein H2200_001488 [Cladophialophora chaetospira]|uniref:Cytochrome P450 n=1 Tax=Cladophialophora chaetospira TaxID=386627 RepID=A0AA39CN32_9EURO|nr:hypothetical protein H2200_001488 [Cladophialophora chaetospira]
MSTHNATDSTMESKVLSYFIEAVAMSDRMTTGAQFAILALLVSALYSIRKRWSQNKQSITQTKYPPSPRTNIFGNHIGQFDPIAPFLDFEKFARQLGKIFMLKLGPQPIVAINDAVLAKELFEKRGSNYSSRKPPYVGYDLLSRGSRIAFMPSGPQHKAYRKQMQMIMSVTRAPDAQKHQLLESTQLLQDFVDFSKFDQVDPIMVQDILRRYTASIMMTLAFGHRVARLGDECVNTVFEIMEDFSEVCLPGRYLVDVYPKLKYLPTFLRPWEKTTNEKIRWQTRFFEKLLERVEEQKRANVANPGLVRTLVDQRWRMSEEERATKYLDNVSISYQAQTIMEAGSDTTAIAMMNCLLGLLNNPDATRKGQKCVDVVCDDTQMPTFEDVEKMPYVRQIVKETLRWRPPILMGIPHANFTEDKIGDYTIPADSVVVGNIWYMNHDPELFSDPEYFEPDRYNGFTKTAYEYSTERSALGRDHFTFGWGRRICPGIHVAEASLNLLVARILWAFDVLPAKDAADKDIQADFDPKTRYHNNVVGTPRPFPIRLVPRSISKVELIKKEHQDALEIWASLGGLDLFKS